MDPGRPGQGVIPFAINSALWSDGAEKSRHIILPPGGRVGFRPDTAFAFPAGTVFAKTFRIDTVEGDPSSRIPLETRLLVHRDPEGKAETRWFGFSYRWARDQSEAWLVDPATGLDTVYRVIGKDGAPASRSWSFPSQNACLRCHLPRGRQVLGFYAAQLHGAVPGRDQLDDLAEAGVFATRPDTSGLHRWYGAADAGASVEARARSYLAANCSFCHGAEGFRALGAFLSALHDFDWFRGDTPLNYVNRPAKFDYGIPGALLVHGGDPSRSILLHRMASRTRPVQMPPLATFAADSAALGLVSEWIRGLPPPPATASRLRSRAKARSAPLSGYDAQGRRGLSTGASIRR